MEWNTEKTYVTRDGRKVKLTATGSEYVNPFTGKQTRKDFPMAGYIEGTDAHYTFTRNGAYYDDDEENRRDIVGEWKEPAKTKARLLRDGNGHAFVGHSDRLYFGCETIGSAYVTEGEFV